MDFILKGDLCYSATRSELVTYKDHYVVQVDGVSQGIYSEVPEEYIHLPVYDYSGHLIVPGLIDLHVHAPQYAIRGMGMDLELLDWLNTYTFPEEAKYANKTYASMSYQYFVDELVKSATSRAVIFATIHTEPTLHLMDLLEKTGLITYVGKVNMDRNSPENLIEVDAKTSIRDTSRWIRSTKQRYHKTQPIITPRFVPTCSDELLEGLGELQRSYRLAVQSHVSENQSEIKWVKELCPDTTCYADAYDRYGLLGGEHVPTIMAHCVWSSGIEEELLKDRGVYVAHCPQSNVNLSSGIAPIRRFINHGIHVGLGSDLAGGSRTSIFRAMADAIQSSKMFWRMVDQEMKPLTVSEAFYLGTKGGGSFFGKVGSLEKGYAFDAVVVEDSIIKTAKTLTMMERIERVIYLSDKRNIKAKYVDGVRVYDRD